MNTLRRSARINVRLVIILGIVLTVLVGGAAAAYYARKVVVARRALAAGTKAFDDRNWTEAARQLRIYFGKYPDNPDVLLKLGKAESNIRPRRIENLDAAVKAYRRYVRLKPSDAAAQAALAELCVLRRRPGDMNIAEMFAARSHEGGDADGGLTYVRVLLSQKTRDGLTKARAVLEDIIRRHPERVDAYALMGTVKAQLNPDQKAPALDHDIQKEAGAPAEWVKAHPDWALMWDSLRSAYEKNAASGRARILLARWHRTRPPYDADKPRTEELTARRTEAEKYLQEIERLPLESPAVLAELAREWLELGMIDRAASALDKAEPEAKRQVETGEDPDALLAVYRVRAVLKDRQRDGAGAGELADRAKRELGGNWSPFLASTGEPEIWADPGAVELYILAKRFDDAAAALTELDDSGFAPGQVPVLRALLNMAKGDIYGENGARAQLEAIVARSPQSMRARFLLARIYLDTDQPWRAAKPLEQLIELRKDITDNARFQLGRARALQGQWARAAEVLEDVVRNDPTNLSARMMLIECQANAALQTGTADATLARLSRQVDSLVQANPRITDLRILQATLAAQQKQLDRAIEILEKAAQETDEPMAARLKLAELCGAYGQRAKAVSYYQAAVKDFPESAEPVIQMARFLMGQSRVRSASRPAATTQSVADARTVLEQALDRVKQSGRAAVRMELAKVLVLQNEYANASQLLADLDKEYAAERASEGRRMDLTELRLRVARGARDWPAVDKLIAELKTHEGEGGLRWRFEQARTLWAKARQQGVADLDAAEAARIEELLKACTTADPEWDDPAVLLAEFYKERERPDQAITIYREILARNPYSTDVLDQMVSLLTRLGRVEDLDRVIESLPADHPQQGSLRAQRDLQQGNYADAEQYFRDRLAENDRDLSAMLSLARLEIARQRPKEADLADAEKHLKRAVEIAPTDLNVAAARVDLLIARQEHGAAARLLEELVRDRRDYAARSLRASLLERIASDARLAKAERDRYLAQSEEAYRALTAIKGFEGPAYEALGAFYNRRGLYNRAVETWEKGVAALAAAGDAKDAVERERRDRQTAAIQRQLVLMLISGAAGDNAAVKSEHRHKGEKLLEDLVKRPEFRRDAELAVIRAMILDSKGPARRAEAAAVLEEAVSANPTAVAAHDLLIQIAIRRAREWRRDSAGAGPATTQVADPAKELAARWAEAKRMADRAVAQNPQHDVLLARLAQVLLESGESASRAMVLAGQARDLAARYRRNNELANEVYLKALAQTSPNDPRARQAIEELTASRPSAPGATGATRPAMTFQPAKLVEMGRYMMAINLPVLAVPLLSQAVERQPDNEQAQLLLANALFGSGKVEEAIKSLETFLARRTDRPFATVLLLGDFYRAAKKYDVARRLAEEARGIDAKNPLPVVLLVSISGEQKEYDKVLETALAFRKAQTELSDRAVVAAITKVTVEACRYLVSSGIPKHTKAAEEMLDVLPVKDQVEGMYTIGQTQYSRQQYDQAIETWRKVVDKAPKHVVAMNDLAWALAEKQGKLSEALSWADKGLATSPNEVHLLDTRGVILYRLGLAEKAANPERARERFAAARRDLENCIQRCAPDPDNPNPNTKSCRASALFHLARVLKEQGDSGAATTALRAAQDAVKEGAQMSDEEKKLMAALAGELSPG